MADARKDKRTLLSLKIRYKSATLEDFIERYSGDISEGGVFIKAKKPLAVGTLLKFEFLLQDQSSVIHGVGRVVWRRDAIEAGADGATGMGIKFVKMDPHSRELVQRIVEGRGQPGVFEQGGPQPLAAVSELASVPSGPSPANSAADASTQVRHVSEFLATAFEEGGAGEAATREAQVGAQRAREVSRDRNSNRAAAARGALGGGHEVPTTKRTAVAQGSARSAMSAFGRSRGSASPAAAEQLEEFDAEDDFLDEEKTRIHDYPDADQTIVGGAGSVPFAPERRPTPLMPAVGAPSPLEAEIPDLFSDAVEPIQAGGLQPAPGEFLDSSLLDPAVPTVPPPAAVPSGPGIPVEAFRQAALTEPAPSRGIPALTERAPRPDSELLAAMAATETSSPSTGEGTGTSRGVLAILGVLIILGVGIAGWQLGFFDGIAALSDGSDGAKKTPAPRAQAPIEETAPIADPVVAAVDPTEVPGDTADESDDTAVEASDAAAVAEAVPEGMAALVIRARPSHAYIIVDGKSMGRSPATITVEPGTEVSVTARAKGYVPRSETITATEGSETLDLNLTSLPYHLEVISSPAGATVTAVGGGQVTTPGELTFKSLRGSRSIVFSKDGFETVSRKVSRREFVEEDGRMVTTMAVTLPLELAQPSKPQAPTPTEPEQEEPAGIPAFAAEPSLEASPADDVP